MRARVHVAPRRERSNLERSPTARAGQCTAVLNDAGEELDLGLAIKEVLEDGDTVIIKHSQQRKAARSPERNSA